MNGSSPFAKHRRLAWRPALAGAALFMCAAQAACAPIGIAQALALGSEHPLSQRASLAAQADDAQATATRRQARWPSIAISGMREQTDALPALDTPLGTITSGEKNRGVVQASMRLPLLNDSARLRAQADALSANAASFSATRMASYHALYAADAYLAILRLRARSKSQSSLQESLRARLERARALLAAGRVLKADVLKIGLEVEQTAQDIVQTNGQLLIAQRELANAVGVDELADAAALDWVPQDLTSSRGLDEQALRSRLRERDDLRALRERIASLSKGAQSLAAEEGHVNADLFIQHDERRGISLLPEHENSIALQFTIPLFNAGSNAPRQLAKLRERDALEAALVDAERAARLEVDRASVSFATAQSLKTLALDGIESATQTRDTRSALYELGRLSVDDLLASESELERQKTLAATVDIDIVQAWLDYQYALGQKMTDLPIPGRL